MQILAHRGLWRKRGERNSFAALSRALDSGHGVELDLRDHDGLLVVSHDPPRAGALLWERFVQDYVDRGVDALVAVNVKADGLIPLLASCPVSLPPTRHFFFDMSVPEQLHYINAGLPTYSRQSNLEPLPTLLDRSSGLWVDNFGPQEWLATQDLAKHLDAGLSVAVVSPELHGRPREAFWHDLLQPASRRMDFAVCTDYPDELAKVLGS